MPDRDFPELEMVKRLLVDPIVDGLKQEMGALRRDIIAHTGRFDDYLKSQHADHENRIREMEQARLPKWFLPAVGVIVAVAAASVSHLAWH